MAHSAACWHWCLQHPQRDGTSSASPAAPASPDPHIRVPSVPKEFSVSLGSDKMPHVSPEIYIYILLCIQRSPLITAVVTRQSVRGNKNRFPKPDIINSALHPSWFKTSMNCKCKRDTLRLLQVLLALRTKGRHKDLSWRCSFPPNNHPGTKWTFLRQNSKDSAIP